MEWARDLPRDASLALRVHLERCAGRADEAALLGQAIHQYFEASADWLTKNTSRAVPSRSHQPVNRARVPQRVAGARRSHREEQR